MTWSSRLRLFVGGLAVIAIVAGLTLLFNQRQHQATSSSAAITAVEYPVGSDYAGTVTRTFVEQGQTVEKGAPLLTVQSATLLRDVRQKAITRTTEAYRVTDSGAMTFLAPVGGTVASTGVQLGAFVQAGSTLLTLDKTDSLAVSAQYLLTARDYERIGEHASVDLRLPNEQVLAGKVSDISVSTEDGRAQAKITVASSGLKEGGDHGLIRAGTPVTAVLHLRDDGPLAGVQDKLRDFLQHIGLTQIAL
jgi:multidrug resistance efflux pump